jgi:hypothetical protein
MTMDSDLLSGTRFFKDFEVRESVVRPRYRVREFPEYKYENWKGDLDQYYDG